MYVTYYQGLPRGAYYISVGDEKRANGLMIGTSPMAGPSESVWIVPGTVGVDD